MNRYLGGITSAAALLAFTASAHATTFLYTGALDSYSVMASGIYDFTVAGAQGAPGGEATFNGGFGGGGALISGDIYLDAGTLLSVLVGGVAGTGGVGESAGAGGGMSFLAIGGTPLIVAGGGGGGYWNGSMNGGPGQIGTSGQSFAGVAGGVGGHGGPAAPSGYGGSGAGWLSDGGPALNDVAGSGGHTGPGFAGGAGYTYDPPGPCCVGPGENGGFGGGGGAGINYGGGGGGYSGGAAGGGGGGSFIDPSVTLITAVAGGNYDPGIRSFGGYVTINFLSAAVPEPATWAMFLVGFGAIGFMMRRNKKAGPAAG